MSNKLTKKMLDALIQEVMLQEDFPYTTPADLFKGADPKDDLGDKNLGKRKQKELFDKFAKLDQPDNQITVKDFDHFLVDEKWEDYDEQMQRLMVALYKSPKTPDDVRKKAEDVMKAFDELMKDKLKKRQTITQPQIRSAGGEVGDFPDELDTILNTVFGGTEDFLERIKKVNKISNFYYQLAIDPEKKRVGKDGATANILKNKPNNEFLAEVMLLEYFAEIVSSFDQGAGAYLFEYFLAALSGGTVTGKETGPGGGMGAVDFRTKGGQAGSAKFYSSSSDISQAISGFKIGEEVRYIIGLKKQTKGQIGTKTAKGGTDPARLIGADIYYVSVKRTGDQEFDVRRVIGTGQLGARNLFKSEHIKGAAGKEQLYFNKYINDKSFLSTLFVAETRTKTFRDMVFDSVSSQTNSLKQSILQEMEKFFVQLDAANANCKKFAASGDLDEGSNTLTAIDAADAAFADFANKFANAAVKDDSGKRKLEKTPVTENKMTELDLMVENMVKQFLKGNLND
jgi:hypothetical protein